MQDTVARLKRLHALRCRMAEVAAAERKEVLQRVHALERTVAALHAEKADSLHAAGANEQPWSERQARWQVAIGLGEHCLMHRHDLVQREEKAASAERIAVQAREQMNSILGRLQAEIARDQSRQDQARLDDLFATARVRAAMATTF